MNIPYLPQGHLFQGDLYLHVFPESKKYKPMF